MRMDLTVQLLWLLMGLMMTVHTVGGSSVFLGSVFLADQKKSPTSPKLVHTYGNKKHTQKRCNFDKTQS